MKRDLWINASHIFIVVGVLNQFQYEVRLFRIEVLGESLQCVIEIQAHIARAFLHLRRQFYTN